jgi:hypothetical protein
MTVSHMLILEDTGHEGTVKSYGQSRYQLPGNIQGFLIREASDSLHQRGEILAVDVFHGEEMPAIHLPDIVDAADVVSPLSNTHLHFTFEVNGRLLSGE